MPANARRNKAAKASDALVNSCRMTIYDFVLTGVLILSAAGCLIPFALGKEGDETGSEAVIRVEGVVSQKVPLTGHTQINVPVPGGTMKLEVEAGRIRVLAADCSQHLCVKQGWAESAYDTIICAPNRTIIEINKVERQLENGVHVLTY